MFIVEADDITDLLCARNFWSAFYMQCTISNVQVVSILDLLAVSSFSICCRDSAPYVRCDVKCMVPSASYTKRFI